MKEKRNYYFWITLAIAVIVGLIAIYWSYKHDYIVVIGDAKAHLNIARRVFDNLTPGLAQLGGVWLPVNHLMMLPFVLNDFLYHSGLAGSIVSFFSYVVATVFLFRTIQKLTKNDLAALIGSLIFCLNPNVLYMQTTAMTEVPTLMFISLSLYYFVDWLQNKYLMSLVYLGGFLFLGSLTRYEFWFLNLGAVIGVFLAIAQERIPSFKRKYFRLEGNVILLASLAFFGIFLWLLWNKLIFNDFTYFMSSAFSAEGYQKYLILEGKNHFYHNFPLALKYYLYAAANNSSWVIFTTGVVGLLAYLFKKLKSSGLALLVFSVSIFLFESISLFKGNTTIFVKELYPYEFYNIRYGLYVLPFLAVFTAYLISIWKNRTISIILAVFALIWVINILNIQKGVSFLEATYRSGPIIGDRIHKELVERDVGKFLHEHYSGGYVLTSAGVSDEIIFFSYVDLKNFITEGSQKYWTISLKNPQTHARWIIVDSTIENIRNSLGRHMYNNQNFRDNFELVYKASNKEVYKRKGTAPEIHPIASVPEVIMQKNGYSMEVFPQKVASSQAIKNANVLTSNKPSINTVNAKTYTMQKGDYLARIAMKIYGDEGMWRQIAQLNHIYNPNHIEVGTVLRLPAKQEEGQSTVAVTPVQPKTSPKSKIPDNHKYQIQQGDSLWNIAEKYYTNGYNWTDIWKANPRITNPNLIYPNQQLDLPPK